MALKKFRSILLVCTALVLAGLLSSCEEQEADNLNDTRPSVRIVSPGKNAVIMVDTDVEIEATDDVGVTRVELYVDHNRDTLERVFTSEPYRWTINVDQFADSTHHVLYADAYDADGNVRRSAWVVFYVYKFWAPESLSVQYITKDSLELRWRNRTKFEKAFKVLVSSDGLNYDTLQTLKAGKNKTTVISALNKANTYYYKVKGQRDSISSPYSNTVKVFFGSGGENLFAGGNFSTADGFSANRIARWDAERWNPANTGTLDNLVWKMHNFKSRLYAGGVFTTIGGNPASRIARWDGSSWSQVGKGFDGTVLALTDYNDTLYAGGYFYKSDATILNYIAKWDGAEWKPVGQGFNGNVEALAVYNNDLYATGDFTKCGNLFVNHIAKWDGTEWIQLGSGIDKKAFALEVYNGKLYVGGMFENAGGGEAKFIAVWNGFTWSNAGEGFDDYVYSLHVYNSELYAGGKFRNSGSRKTDRIARWDGTGWTFVGTGIDPNNISAVVYSMATYNGGLYAAGLFTKAGNADAPLNIARWNGLAWEEVGGGLNSTTYTLETYRGNSWQWVSEP